MWRTSFPSSNWLPSLKGWLPPFLEVGAHRSDGLLDPVQDEEMDPVATKSRLITSKVMVVLLGFMVIWMGFR